MSRKHYHDDAFPALLMSISENGPGFVNSLMVYKVLESGNPDVAKRCFPNGFLVFRKGLLAPRQANVLQPVSFRFLIN